MIPLLLVLLSLTPPLREYKVVDVLDVYDGDTATVRIEAGLANLHLGLSDSIQAVLLVRVYGIDTPEIRPLATRAAGEAARDWLRVRLAGCADLRLITGTEKDGTIERGKFGRVLGTFTCDGRSITQEMLDLGHGVPYYGGTK